MTDEIIPSTPDPQPTAEPPAPVAPPAMRWPAEYYSAPAADVTPILPRWVPIGCGSVAAVLLVLLFVGGALLSSGRLASAMDLMLSLTFGELRGMYAEDVKDTQRQALDGELTKIRESIRTGKLSMPDLQPFLRTMQDTIGDDRVTAKEVEALTKEARAINEKADKPESVNRRPSTADP